MRKCSKWVCVEAESWVALKDLRKRKEVAKQTAAKKQLTHSSGTDILQSMCCRIEKKKRCLNFMRPRKITWLKKACHIWCTYHRHLIRIACGHLTHLLEAFNNQIREIRIGDDIPVKLGWLGGKFQSFPRWSSWNCDVPPKALTFRFASNFVTPGAAARWINKGAQIWRSPIDAPQMNAWTYAWIFEYDYDVINNLTCMYIVT